MSLKFYAYKNCSTCRKAEKYLEAQNISFEKLPIRETPPSKNEIKKMLLLVGEIRKLFNTSGGDYKQLKLKDKLPAMSESDAISLLASNGNLIKRPFVLHGNKGTVGFKEDVWEKLF